MAFKIASVRPGGLAARHGLRAGDAIEQINGEPLIDQVDYEALTARSRVRLSVIKTDGERREITIIKPRETALGLEMESAFTEMKPMQCKNHCVFCFIDQMPPHMRKTLYVKDDDWRFSLMMGNYITLTNLSDDEFDRLIRRKASPLYISVHAMDPEVRVRMMLNPAAARLPERLDRLKAAGIRFNCQIVLCPGINDGPVLDDTLERLSHYLPNVQSVAVVPVGLTKFREKLPKLSNFDPDGALSVIRQAERWQKRFLEIAGTRFVFPSDEFYCRANVPLPDEDWYEGYPQIENGVGLLRQYEEALAARSRQGAEAGERGADRKVAILCGTSVAPVMREWIARYAPPGPRVTVHPVVNRFFGETITVTGLLTGQDLLKAAEESGADEIMISANTLRSEGDLFLDDMPLTALTERFRVAVIRGGASLYESLLGTK